jgi:hypothetical protein
MIRRFVVLVVGVTTAVVGLGIGTASGAPASSCEALINARSHIEAAGQTPPDGFVSILNDHCVA